MARVRARFKKREELPQELLCCDWAFSACTDEVFEVDTEVRRRSTGALCVCGARTGCGAMLLLDTSTGMWVQALAVDLEEGGCDGEGLQ